MKDFFATFYETWFGLYESQFSLIFFDTLYNNGGYIFLGLTFIFVPLIMFASFYFLWKYPYGKLWHWFLWLLIVLFITGGISWGISNNQIFLTNNQALIDALADSGTGYEEYANAIAMKYSLINGLSAMIFSLFCIIIMKPFSKIHKHLPF